MDAFRPYLWVLLLLFAGSNAVLAQETKIGLALSGGGAKGLAHVGILQAIDSAGLKIDYLTGTSMGSIVGAMYAAGYSGNQIDSIAKRLNWEEMLSGKPKFTDVGMDEKSEFGRYALEIYMDGFKPNMGTGLIESEEVWLQFSEIFFPVYDQKDFTKFNIPFKCIATDLSTGKAVVLSSGEIVKALRSSMAMPSIFSAVEHDSTFLIDGGIVRNFPVSDAIEMGADYVIGVNLYAGLSDAKDINSALDVMYQITNYRDADDLITQKEQCNLLIEPPMQGYSSASFSEADEILDIGYAMREKYYPYFKKLADSLQNNKDAYDAYSRLDYKKTVILDSIEVIGLEKIDEKMLIEKSNLTLGVPLTAEEMNQAFRYVYSTLSFKYVYYQLIPTQKGRAKMLVHVREQPRSQMNVGFSYNSFTTPAVILNYTMRNMLSKRSRTMFKLGLSKDFKILAEHKQFFGHGSNKSLTLQLKHIQQRVNIYNDDEISSQYKTANSAIALAYHHHLSRSKVLGASMEYRNTNFSPNIASTFRFDGYNRDFFLGLYYLKNTTNRPFLPTSGVEMAANVGLEFNRKFNSYFTGSNLDIDTTFTIVPKDPLFRFDFYINWYKPLGLKTVLLANIQGGRLFDDENFYLDNLLIGGSKKLYKNQFHFVGYQDGQIASTSFASALLGIQYKIVGELYVQGNANVGFYDFVNASGLVNDIHNQFISGFSAVVAYNFSMLPLDFSVSYTPDLNIFYSHINIGFVF